MRKYRLQKGVEEIESLCDRLYIPQSVKNKAFEIYCNALDKGLVDGRKSEVMATASLYAACRVMKLPRTLDDIIKGSSASWREVARSYKLLLQEGNIKVVPPDPSTFVPRISEELEISLETQQLAIDYLKKAEKRKLILGKRPNTIAAAVLYIACRKRNENRTQHELAEAANTMESSLRTYIHLLENELESQ